MNTGVASMTGQTPEFHYCGRCGFLVERCSCIHARPTRLNIRPEQVNEIRDAIDRGGRVRV